MSLLDRVEECRTLGDLLATAREGRGAALVIRGEAGIGKTALIDYAVAAASDFLVVRFTGVESESELGFAALHRLLTPILHQIERLPPPQRDALNSALGLAEGPPASLFLVGLGVISLAANAARARERLLCVIDDAHWVDRESLDALAFWARRLHADRIAVIFGERSLPMEPSPLDGFTILETGGLSNDAARALVTEGGGAGDGLDGEIVDRIIADAVGNPLALIELAKDLRADQLIGAAAALRPLPLTGRMEQRFARQVRSLPAETQMLVLLAAADSTGDPAFLARAATRLGVTMGGAEPAEATGLLVVGSAVTFRHPLIRSAVYGTARPADRRAVHRALAAATDDDPERRAWHLAAAVLGSDEEVASTLERSGRRAGARGGHTAAVALLDRAAELTPDRERAAGRRVAAAEAALDGGAPQQVHALVALALPDLRDGATHARAERLDGCAWAREGNVAVAAPVLLSAALELLPTDPDLGRQTLLEALEAALLTGNATETDRGVTGAVARAALAAPPGRRTIVDLLLDAFATCVATGYRSAAPLLRLAVTAMGNGDVPPDQLLRWAALASDATRLLWDHVAEDALMNDLIQVGRERGALGWLSAALQASASTEIASGRFGAAEAHIAEAADLTAAAGRNPVLTKLMDLELVAARGHAAHARAKARAVMALAEDRGLGSAATMVHAVLLGLDISVGQYGDALGHAAAVFDRDPVPWGTQILPDMVEAAVRAGDPLAANRAMDRLADRAPASGTASAMGLMARSRAVLATDDAEAFHTEAIALLASSGLNLETARAHLLFGEWLRRQRRRIDARGQLRIAHDMFTTIGAEAFAARARDELLATGERARKRTVDTSRDLTPQEAHVASLAATGETNAEIAAQLYISTSTVEYHLRKVFRKLTITSRRQLARALSDGGRGSTPGHPPMSS